MKKKYIVFLFAYLLLACKQEGNKKSDSIVTNNSIIFIATSTVNSLVEPCDFKIKLPPNQKIVHISHYRIGFIKTKLGNNVTAMKLIEGAFDLEIVPSIGEIKRLFNEYPYTKLLEHFNIPIQEFIPQYNCFGYCFANSECRIPDPSQILKDEYLECIESEATILISYKDSIPVHGAKKVNDKYFAKSGVMALKEFKDFLSAISEIPYDYYKFYKIKKEQNQDK